jgi:hypothetical protein
MSTSASSPRTCSYPRCGRKAHGWSPHCGEHAAQAYRHGAPGKAGVRETDYRPFNNWTGAGIAKYRSTRATEAALTLAQQLLDFEPTNGFRYQLELQRMMCLLKGDEVQPSDVLHRVCLHVAFATSNPARFTGGEKVERLAIGRTVMRLAPLQRHGKRYSSRALYLLGDTVMSDGLYLYAIRLIDKLKTDDEKAYALKQAALDFDTPATVTADPPRAGVRYRKRRGVQIP